MSSNLGEPRRNRGTVNRRDMGLNTGIRYHRCRNLLHERSTCSSHEGGFFSTASLLRSHCATRGMTLKNRRTLRSITTTSVHLSINLTSKPERRNVSSFSRANGKALRRFLGFTGSAIAPTRCLVHSLFSQMPSPVCVRSSLRACRAAPNQR